MILEKRPEIRRLSPAEKLALVSELSGGLASEPANVLVTDEQLAELDRLEEYRRDPIRVTAWNQIKQRILSLD